MATTTPTGIAPSTKPSRASSTAPVLSPVPPIRMIA